MATLLLEGAAKMKSSVKTVEQSSHQLAALAAEFGRVGRRFAV